MIKTILAALGICLLLAACKKSDPAAATVVEYQVGATNSSNIDIIYNNVLEHATQVNAKNNWVFDVTVDQKPFNAYLQASSTSPFSSVQTDCTVSILVNGSVVKTVTVSSNTLAVAEATYTVQ